jgi:hypothetical protein
VEIGKDFLAEEDEVLKGEDYSIDAFVAKVGSVGTTMS